MLRDGVQPDGEEFKTQVMRSPGGALTRGSGRLTWPKVEEAFLNTLSRAFAREVRSTTPSRMNALVRVVCSAYFCACFFPAPLDTLWHTAIVDDIAGPTSRVDQHHRQMTLAPFEGWTV